MKPRDLGPPLRWANWRRPATTPTRPRAQSPKPKAPSKPPLPVARGVLELELATDEQDNATMRTSMIGKRMIGFWMCALALTALALLWSAPRAVAGQYDGSWSMIVQTTNGHCGQIKVGLAISGGHITSTSGKFVGRRIQVVGIISGSGAAKINAWPDSARRKAPDSSPRRRAPANGTAQAHRACARAPGSPSAAGTLLLRHRPPT